MANLTKREIQITGAGKSDPFTDVPSCRVVPAAENGEEAVAHLFHRSSPALPCGAFRAGKHYGAFSIPSVRHEKNFATSGTCNATCNPWGYL
jgi:hypothetical protein